MSSEVIFKMFETVSDNLNMWAHGLFIRNSTFRDNTCDVNILSLQKNFHTNLTSDSGWLITLDQYSRTREGPSLLNPQQSSCIK